MPTKKTNKTRDLLPKSWKEVSLVQYQEIRQVDMDNDLGDTDRMFEVLAILLNIMPDDPLIEDISADDLLDCMNHLMWMRKKPHIMFKDELNGYIFKPFDKLTNGEFIDLKHFFSEDYIRDLHIICAIMYRQRRSDDWGNQEIEPYKYDLYQRADQFLDVSIQDVWGIINAYTNFNKEFNETYEYLLDNPNGEDDELTEAEDDEWKDADTIREEIVEKARKKWSWEHLIWSLAKEDITKMEAVFDTNLILTFNILAMKKSLDV